MCPDDQRSPDQCVVLTQQHIDQKHALPVAEQHQAQNGGQTPDRQDSVVKRVFTSPLMSANPN